MFIRGGRCPRRPDRLGSPRSMAHEAAHAEEGRAGPGTAAVASVRLGSQPRLPTPCADARSPRPRLPGGAAPISRPCPRCCEAAGSTSSRSTSSSPGSRHSASTSRSVSPPAVIAVRSAPPPCDDRGRPLGRREWCGRARGVVPPSRRGHAWVRVRGRCVGPQPLHDRRYQQYTGLGRRAAGRGLAAGCPSRRPRPDCCPWQRRWPMARSTRASTACAGAMAPIAGSCVAACRHPAGMATPHDGSVSASTSTTGAPPKRRCGGARSGSGPRG